MIDLILGAITLGIILTVFNFIAFYPLCKKEQKLIKSGKVSRGKKLLCTSQTVDMQIVDLPRCNWSYLPPKKWQIALTFVGIVLTAIAWSLT